MRKLLSIILILCMLPAFALGEETERGGRGTVEIIDEEIEGEYEDEFYGEDDVVVYDPSEELELDDVTIDNSLNTLSNVKNILLLGVDSRSKKGFAGRTDTMMLMSVDIESHTIRLVSFMRDMYVEIPGNKNNRLNSAYVFGYNKNGRGSQDGFALLASTLERNFGIRPDAYIVINLSCLVDIIDQLGGVYVDVPDKRVDRVNAVIYWYNQQVLGMNEKSARQNYLTHGGYQLLNGVQAEAWARYRYSEDDFQRSGRQRQLIEMLFEKIKGMSVSDLGSFAMKNMGLIETNLSLSDIIALAPSVMLMKDAEIKQMTIPVRGAYSSKTISQMAVLVPDRQANIRALRDFFTN
ncbi:MAG: LCP family protein [Clostridia bacterium]|nr:LCP family protein [Clostridia bacterium]